MARRRVTYLEVADRRPGQVGPSTVVDLDSWRDQPVEWHARPARREWPECPAWVAMLTLLALVASGVLLAHVTTGPDEQAALDRALDRRRPVGVEPAAGAVRSASGPVAIPTRSVLGEPWGGVFEHHPDARGEEPAARVHVVTLAGPGGRAVLVVDATRRAFGGPEHPTDRARPPRSLGSETGAGLRTLQWDAGGYGLSLTTVGLTPSAQQAVADAVRLPAGASLQHGEPPALDEAVLDDVGLAVMDLRGGAASAFGSPLIGQAGGASIEAQLHQDGRAALLVSVVQDQLADAAWLRSGLGPTVAIDPGGLPGVTVAAALDHGPARATDRRIRGWARLVLDHAGGATIELSSDVLRPAELLEAARAMDLARLVRTAAPLGSEDG